MAAEAKRGCGYRKIGGLYLMGGNLSAPCCKMPIPLHVCPTCGGGIKQSMGWTWIDPQPFLAGEPCTAPSYTAANCPIAYPQFLGGKAGLLWVGKAFYKTPEMFLREARHMGVSRRIKAVPREFKLGETWVFLAHAQAIVKPGTLLGDEPQVTPGIFSVFKPIAIEKIVTDKEAQDVEAMAALRDRDITPVIVPADDKDHRGSVYDKEDETVEPELEMA